MKDSNLTTPHDKATNDSIILSSGDIEQLLLLKAILHELTTSRRLLNKNQWLAIHSGLIDFAANTLYEVGGK